MVKICIFTTATVCFAIGMTHRMVTYVVIVKKDVTEKRTYIN